MEEAEDGIAVVGIGCSFPGGEGLENFWKVLLEGRNCSVPIPKERFDFSSWYDPDDNKAGKSRTAKAALIDGFNEFDHKFFGISESEVEQMDPQQKLLLQCVFRALENAGVPLEEASGTRTGVFIGLMNRDYETNAAHVHPSVINHWTGTGLAMSLAANRVSYVFNFTGPSLSVDCACSSSLVALHLACQSIRQGDCDMAVCGGVNCIIEPRVFVALSKAKMISPEGTSRPFSNRADGYGRGEGCGIVLLKPLKKAMKDCDHIWGIISQSAVNQDGHSASPITKPSMSQQEELLRSIYSESDLVDVQYIEAHGTGTPTGDSTEAQSISNAIAKARPAGSEALQIGSVKGNIGHTESASGVAGLIKVLLMMKHQIIVPSVFFSEETASFDAEAMNIKVPTEAAKWDASGVRVAGVNNFGFGGSNAHVIIKQHKQTPTKVKNDRKLAKFFVLSANSPKSLILTVKDTIAHLEADSKVDLESLLYTSACRRSHLKHKYRKAIKVASTVDLIEKLKSTVSKNMSHPYADPRLVFVFSGNGVTHHRMCRQLLTHEPLFREKVKEISQLFLKLSKLDVLETLESEFEGNDTHPNVVQPLLFAVQTGISTLLRHWGVKPDVVLGHSVGEVAAAHCSGLLSLEDAVKVIYVRSSLQSKVTGGRMLVISNMDVSEVAAILPQYSGRISLAAFNSPKSCTVSGDAEALEKLHEDLSTLADGHNLFLRLLDVPAGYHSHMMDPILAEVKERIGHLQVHSLHTELVSTLTGNEVKQGDFCTGEYWARNIREPVAFEQAVKSASKGKRDTVFVEIGPKKVLQRNIVESVGSDTLVLASVLPEKDHETIMSVVFNLFELGFQVDWSSFYRGSERVPLPIPKYQFDVSARDVIIGAAQNYRTAEHPVLYQTGGESNIFSCDLTSESSSYLKQHKHNGVPIVPAAFYVELGLAAFMAIAKPKVPLSSLELSVHFHSPFLLTQNVPEMKVKIDKVETDARFTVYSSCATYASGSVVSKKERLVEEESISLKSLFKRCKSVVGSQELYRYLSDGGFQYGSVFKNKADVHFGEDLREAFTWIQVPEELRSQMHEYCIHPVVLDFLMQLLPVTVLHIFAGRPGFPAKVGSLTVCQPLQEEMIIYLRATDVGVDHIEICGCLADKEGGVLVEVKHVIIKYLSSHSHMVEEYFYHNAFSVVPDAIMSASPPKALVFSDDLGISEGLQQYLDCSSRRISHKHAEDILSHGFPSLLANLKITDIDLNFEEILFMWGNEDLTSLPADVVLQNLVSCCEIFRQIVLNLKQIHFPNSIRAITYRSSDITVDHISPGFALAGMTRSLAAELPDLLFQLTDVHATSVRDIAALAKVLRSYPCRTYPELVVKDGQILRPSIVRTPPETTDSSSQGGFTSTKLEPYILHTADAHKMVHLKAIHSVEDAHPTSDTSVKIRPTKICVHSSDYFPISAAHLKFGQTLYWNKLSSQNHQLLALDFSGAITAVGKKVRKLKVGDHVACCYPVVAASEVTVPERVCFSSKRFPILQKIPCVSYFVLAWEILHKALPQAKKNLGIISLVPDSALVKVLEITSYKCGWTVIMGTQCNGAFVDVKQIDAIVFLPPFDESLTPTVCNFPGVQHAVFICDAQTNSLLSQDVLQSLNESVQIRTVQVSVVLQKGSLSAEMPRVYSWLKSLNFSRKFSLESFIFQSLKSGIVCPNLEAPQSYFLSKKVGVLSLEDEKNGNLSDFPLLQTKKPLFQKRSVYIVAGGLSGLGFETVKFISQRGGEHIVILSRNKPSPDVEEDLQIIERQCRSSITTVQCDISVSECVHQVIRVISQKFAGFPVRGVFHSAVVLHDGLIENLHKSLYQKVLKPKVNGVLNLHHATLHCSLDYFVCYSSISAFLGNAAQTNYAAANTFLDMFCQYRRKLGLPAQSISWGALNLGLLLNKEHLQRFLEAKGMMVLDVAEIHKSLEQCLVLNQPQQAVCKFHFRNIRYNILSQNAAMTMRMSALVEEAFQKSRVTDFLSVQAESAPPKEYVVSLLCETMGLEVNQLTDESLLSVLGLDSMQAMTVQNLIFQERGVNVPLVKLLDPNATLSSIVTMLSEEGKSLSDDLESLQSKDMDQVCTRL